jgi:pimeloyl-ACP methyl ester carboxylesterase
MLQFERNSIDRAGQIFRGRGTTFLAIGAALAAAALVVRYKTRQAEKEHPPRGKFIEVDGVRLHYIERGHGQPLVLLHGNGVMAEDFELSGLADLAARQYRVIAFDRPGYGYSERPRSKIWTPHAQADLLYRALQRLGIEHPIIVGHSWGTLVAIALALRHRNYVRSLVLLSGYYFPSMRLDVPLSSPPAIPILGDLMRYTVSPLLGRLLWPQLVRHLFGPSVVPARFGAFPLWLALRPSQLRASAAESALMIPAAFSLRRRYGELTMPVVILAGDGDRVANAHRQSARLHDQLARGGLRLVENAGHMVHYVASHQVMAAINSAEEAAQHADDGPAPVHALRSDAPIPTIAPERA